ncbi:MAG TPA: S9 family peptidase [Bryobacteraceae bacterium]|nr:S9 family peptidase [Bryobacteraceae bacterium]
MRALKCRSSLFVLVVLQSATSLVTGAPSQALQDSLRRIFTTDELATKYPKPMRWLEDGRALSAIEPSAKIQDGSEIVNYDTATGERKVLAAASLFVPQGAKKPLDIEDYQWSQDRRELLIFTNTKPVWRRHTRGDYWVLNVASRKLIKLGGPGPESSMMFAKFSPDGKSVAFVRGNNIFVQDLNSLAIRQLTQDGSATTINGTSDWVYEEEFDVRDGFRWSPDGTRIAFWHFDSKGVGLFPLVDYTDSAYPTIREIPYPQAGTTNSAVTIGVVDLQSGAIKTMQVGDDPRNNYIPRMEWVANSSTELVLEHFNRLQNSAELLIANALTGMTKPIFEDKDRAWVDVNDIHAYKGGYIWLSERDGWRHAYWVRAGGSAPELLTPGNFDVIDLVLVAEAKNAIYYSASPKNATQSYLYRSTIGAGNGEPERITPSDEPGDHQYDISPDGQWALHTYSTFDDPPRMEIVALPGHKVVRVLEDNAELRAQVRPLLENKSIFFQIAIDDGVVMDGWMIRPKDFNPGHKYPVLVNVYGEPAAQTVVDRWAGSSGLFHRALAQEGYIVVSFDNRGTPAPKGREWRKIVYGSIGPLATADQTAAVKKFCEVYPSYLDAQRIAVWGWSGGATDTLNLLFRSPEVYKVGMAVAPVPDQRLYDSIYQERYMGLPKENREGYQRGSAINFAAGLKGHLLIVHGTGDDNVHFQGTEMLINKLVALGKQFDFMEYPNRTHAIDEGEGTTIHLYTLLSRFLEDHLPPGR